MAEAAAKLEVSAHQIRHLIKEGVLPAKQVVFDAPFDSSIFRTSASKSRWRRKVARVGLFPKTKHQSFQILDNEVHNEQPFATDRRARSAAVLSISMRPSSR